MVDAFKVIATDVIDGIRVEMRYGGTGEWIVTDSNARFLGYGFTLDRAMIPVRAKIDQMNAAARSEG